MGIPMGMGTGIGPNGPPGMPPPPAVALRL